MGPSHHFAFLARKLHLYQLQRQVSEDFCKTLKAAWDMVPSVPVRSPQMYHLGLLIHATIAAIEAGPLLADPSVVANAEQQLDDLLCRMWTLGPMFKPWKIFLWSYQALYFQVVIKNTAKARTFEADSLADLCRPLNASSRRRVCVTSLTFMAASCCCAPSMPRELCDERCTRRRVARSAPPVTPWDTTKPEMALPACRAQCRCTLDVFGYFNMDTM